MTDNYQKKYIEFASNISFYEFLLNEFKEPHFEVEGYSKEINELSYKKSWNIKSLSEFVRNHPKSFSIFQEVLQLSRFTNTQITHYLFDVSLLNSNDKEILSNYLIKNLNYDIYFLKIYRDELNKTKVWNDIIIDSSQLVNLTKSIVDSINNDMFDFFVFILKITISKYISDCVVKNDLIYKRLSNKEFNDVSLRFAKYIIENLNFNDILKGIKLNEFLSNKRIAIDTKSIHGKFGIIKIKSILNKRGIANADDSFNKLGIKELNNSLLSNPELKQYSNKTIYLTEKYVKDIQKNKEKKLKKFDFVILYNLKPKILIETNFYSTSGTKIAINQQEYIDLKEEIQRKSKDYLFLWITDGNYWLTKQGYSNLINLYNYFGNQLLNYNLFEKKLPELFERIKNENNP